MSSADGPGPAEPPWSPFPVQDWSRLPEDPLAPMVDPRWAPPESRRWWFPLVVLAVVAGLVATAAWAGTSLGVGSRTTAATRFLPDNGDAAYERIQTTRETTTTTAYAVTESALFTGVAGLLSGDFGFTTQALPDVYDQPDVRLWRTTTTGVAAPAPVDQTTRYYQVNDAVQLLGEATPTEGYTYSPALVELPADVAVGQRWTSAGSAGATLDYRSELAATAAADGCLQVDGLVAYRDKSGAPSATVGLQRRWCPGQGLVAASQSRAPVTTVVNRLDGLPSGVAAPTTTTDTPVVWSDPSAWRERELSTTSINAVFGEGPMGGTTHGSVIPVRTESGLLIRPLSAQDDLVATTPKTPQTWTSVWRTHPGGTILTLAAFGNVIVVTTSERRVVAYTDAGVRLWTQSLDDLAPTPAVRLSADSLGLADLSGEVRAVDLATGTLRWRHRLGADVGVAPASGAGLMVVADRSGTTTALDAADGSVRWTAALTVKGLAVAGDAVVAVQDQSAHALAVDSGRTRWVRPYLGIFSEVAALGDHPVLASRDATVMLDAGGVELGRWAGSREITTSSDQLVSWGEDQAFVVDADGQVVHRFPIPPTTQASQLRAGVATPQGVQLYAADWTFRTWTDE